MLSAGIMMAENPSGTCGANLTWTLNRQDSVLTIEGSGDMRDYSTALGAPWSPEASNIKTVSLPEGLTRIGAYAFRYLYSNVHYDHLKSITVPNSVTSIGAYAFWCCDSLETITIGSNVAHVGAEAFQYCDNLTIVNTTMDIAHWCAIDFEDETSNPLYNAQLYVNGQIVNVLTIPGTVTSIGNWAFANCKSLMSVSIPSSVMHIGTDAFKNCQQLTSIYVAADNANYCSQDDVLFNKEQSLLIQCPAHIQGAYVIPNSVVDIRENAFWGCHNLTSVVISDGVKNIGNRAFYDCINLTSVSMGNNVENIGEGAFYNCSNMSSCALGNRVTSIGDDAFNSCISLGTIEIPNSVRHIGKTAFSNCSSLQTINISDSVSYIGGWAFAACPALKSIKLPKALKGKNDGTYPYIPLFDEQCTSLTSIIWNVQKYGTEEQMIGQYYTSVFDGIKDQITAFTLGDDVESIPSCLFYNLSRIHSITIPKNVKEIQAGAFTNSAIDTIFWNAKSCYAGLGTFQGINDKIKMLQFGNDVDSIQNYSFTDLPLLDSLSIPQNVTYLGSNCFTGSPKIKTIQWNAINAIFASFDAIASQITSFVIGEDVHKLPNGLCQGMNNLTTITIPNAISEISAYCFSGCTSLTSIEWGNNITAFKNNAFENCSSITAIELPQNLASISPYAFKGCSGLTSIELPNSLISLGTCAFNECSGLTSITIPQNLSVIDAEKTEFIHGLSFDGCSSLTSVIWNAKNCSTALNTSPFIGGMYQITSFTISDNVDTLPKYLCCDLTNITSITIPESVKYIGTSAFKTGWNLQSVHINNIEKWNEIEFEDVTASPLYYARNLYVQDTLMTTLVLPEGITSIGNYNYSNAKCLTTLVLPSTLENLGEYAFGECSNIQEIYTYATIPPTIADENGTFTYDVNCAVYVPKGTLNDYKVAYGWKRFFDAGGMSEMGISYYTITFQNWDGTELLTLSEVEEGTLPAYTAELPTRPEDDKFTYTFIGWTPEIVPATEDATYTATYEATPKTEGIEDVIIDDIITQKLLHNGQIFILRGNKTYTLQGQEVK